MLDEAEVTDRRGVGRPRRPDGRAIARVVGWAVPPWVWFLVRDVHPRADLVAIGLPVLVLAVGAGCAFLVAVHWYRHRLAPRRTRVARGPAIGLASWTLFGLVAIVGPWVPRPGPAPVDAVRIAAANIYGDRPDRFEIVGDILAQDADVVVVSESSPGPVRLLVDEYPHGAAGPHRDDVSVLSRFPVRELALPDEIDFLGERAARLEIDGPAGPFVLYALHLPPVRLTPTASDELSVTQHQRMVDKVSRAIADEALPVVVAGDLNLVDRAGGFRTLTNRLDDAMRDGWVRPTSRKLTARLILARVDHVLMPADWCSTATDVFTLRGSDHHGVVATVGRCP